MITERPQDKWLGPAANTDAIHLIAGAQTRLNRAWWRVILSGALLVVFGFGVAARLEDAERNETTAGLAVFSLVALVRFGYYLYRLISTQREVSGLKRLL